jgi:hypothetical protein
MRASRRPPRGEPGQAIPLVIGGLAVLLLGAAVLAAIASGLTGRGDQQRAADLSALAAARAMAVAYPHVFEPAAVAGRVNPSHLEREEYLVRARKAAEAVARANGLNAITVSFPDAASVAPLRVRVTVLDVLAVGDDVAAGTRAEAELVPAAVAVTGPANAGEYAGPYALRQGKP